MSKWKEVDGAKNLPDGVWLVKLENGGFHVATANKNIAIVGHYFYFDEAKVVSYTAIPD
jgi:hypothetical protein